jgi:rare lipoprotein A
MPHCHHLLLLIGFLVCSLTGEAQMKNEGKSLDTESGGKATSEQKDKTVKSRVLYGTASFYADKFNGRQTATGHIYSHDKYTAACNVLPLGTWIRVTNLRNNYAVIVQINDRLHPKNKRIVDLSKVAATKLGYIKRGLTQVKVEVLGRVKPKT